MTQELQFRNKNDFVEDFGIPGGSRRTRSEQQVREELHPERSQEGTFESGNSFKQHYFLKSLSFNFANFFNNDLSRPHIVIKYRRIF